MCGIYGYCGNPNSIEAEKKTLKLFVCLGELTEGRGVDATGFYGLNDKVVSNKFPVKASKFYSMLNFTDSYLLHFPTIMIGHNRHATHGLPAYNENNHPFSSKRFGFIHNGVVGYVTADKEDELKLKSECDSEKIFAYFRRDYKDSHNIINSIAKSMKAYDRGSLACAMVDNVDRALYLFRNIGYGISYCRVPELNIFVFASTKEILSEALKKIGVVGKDIKTMDTGRILKVNEKLEITKYKVEGLRKPESNLGFYYKFFPPKADEKKEKKDSSDFTNYSLFDNSLDSMPVVPPKTTTVFPRKIQGKLGKLPYGCWNRNPD